MSLEKAQPRRLALVALLLVAALLGTYANHFHNPFQFDDTHTIETNAFIQDLRNIPSFFTDARTFSSLPTNQSYRPVVTTLNAIDYWLAGGAVPFAFHVSIFFWYVVLLVVLFFFLERLFRAARPHPWNPIFALGTTAFYGFHTANAETVNYVISRSDSFSTLCVVASLWLFQMRLGRRYLLYLPTLALGIYTKQSALMFVPLLFLYLLFFEEENREAGQGIFDPKRLGRAAWRSAPAFALGTSLFLVNQLWLTPATTVSSNAAVSRFEYAATQLWVYLHYLANFVLPLRLSADPDFQLISEFSDLRILAGAVVALALVAVALFTARRRETAPIGYGILWFFLALAPTSSFVPLFQIANDHRTFFPYIGLAFACGWALALLVMRNEATFARDRRLRIVAVAALALVLGGHAYGVRQRNQVWSSDATLWHDVTVKSPRNPRGLMNYGLSQMELARYDVAEDYFARSMALHPNYPYLHLNLGILKAAQRKPGEAELHFQNAIRFAGLNPEPPYYYARWLMSEDRYDEAIELLEKGLQSSPGHTLLRAGLEKARQAQKGRAAALEARWQQVLSAPSPPGYLEVGLELYEAGRYADSISAWQAYLELRPGNALVLSNICSARNHLTQWELAIDACEQALAIDPEFERAKANLQWAHDGQSGG